MAPSGDLYVLLVLQNVLAFLTVCKTVSLPQLLRSFE